MERSKFIFALCLFATAIVLPGCGSSGAGPTPPPASEYFDAGLYVSSQQHDPSNDVTNWTIRTSKTAFAAYTSLNAEPDTPVTLILKDEQGYKGIYLGTGLENIPVAGSFDYKGGFQSYSSQGYKGMQ